MTWFDQTEEEAVEAAEAAEAAEEEEGEGEDVRGVCRYGQFVSTSGGRSRCLQNY